MSRGKRVLLVLVLCAMLAAAVTAYAGVEATSAAPVVIVAPEAGCVASVGDVLNVLVVVSQEVEAASVAVLCDARGVGMLQSPPYTFKWDTKGLEPGEHIVRAFVYLKSGEKVGAVPVVVALTQTRGPESVQTAAAPMVLKEGTVVLLQTQEKMVSGRIAEGAPVRYKIARDVVAPNGQLLIAYGGFAEGRVTRSRRRGMFGKAGQLEFTVDAATAVDGTRVPLRSSQEMAGKDNKGTVIATALLLTVFTVFIQGKDVELPAATEVAAYVDHDTEIRSPQEAPTGGLRGEPEESAAINRPTEGQRFGRTGNLEVVLAIFPERKLARARLYVDGHEAAAIEGELRAITLGLEKFSPGDHTLEAQVQFLNGRVIRTGPVRIWVGGA